MVARVSQNGKIETHTGDRFKVGHWLCDPRKLKPSPENETLYKERNENDSDWKRFLEGVQRDGEIQQEILVDRHCYVISGHRRLRAALLCGFAKVPIRVVNIFRNKHSADEWVKILREQNTGPEKTCVERIRERIIDIDPMMHSNVSCRTSSSAPAREWKPSTSATR